MALWNYRSHTYIVGQTHTHTHTHRLAGSHRQCLLLSECTARVCKQTVIWPCTRHPRRKYLDQSGKPLRKQCVFSSEEVSAGAVWYWGIEIKQTLGVGSSFPMKIRSMSVLLTMTVNPRLLMWSSQSFAFPQCDLFFPLHSQLTLADQSAADYACCIPSAWEGKWVPVSASWEWECNAAPSPAFSLA